MPLIVIFTRAIRKPAHIHGCGPSTTILDPHVFCRTLMLITSLPAPFSSLARYCRLIVSTVGPSLGLHSAPQSPSAVTP
jgi:hypothetical protein